MKSKLYLITILAIMLICLMPSLAFADSSSTRLSDGRFSVTLDNTNGDVDLFPGDLPGRVSSVPGAPGSADIYELIIDSSISGIMNSTDIAYINSLTNLEVLSVASTISVDNAGENFLYNNNNITSVTFPALMFGDRAFQGCTNLTSVSLPNATTFVNFAFAMCNSLTSITLPEATTFALAMFFYSTALSSVNLPKLETAGVTAFDGCTSLTELALGSAIPDVDGWGSSLPATRTVNVPDGTAAAYDATSAPDGDGLWEGWILSPAPGGEDTGETTGGGTVVSNPQTGEALWFDGLVEWLIDIF